jgi:hypothetical protein
MEHLHNPPEPVRVVPLGTESVVTVYFLCSFRPLVQDLNACSGPIGKDGKQCIVQISPDRVLAKQKQ